MKSVKKLLTAKKSDTSLSFNISVRNAADLWRNIPKVTFGLRMIKNSRTIYGKLQIISGKLIYGIQKTLSNKK